MSRRETNTRLREPITVRSTSSGLPIYYYCSFGAFWTISYPSPLFKALLFYLTISPVPTCLAHNCETSRRFAIPICCHLCLKIKFPLIPINDKPGNGDKRPYKTSSQKPSPPGPSKNKNQSFRARLMKLLEEESDDPEFPPEDVNVNSMSIEEIPDPVPPSRKGKGTPKLDFPLGL